MNSNRRWGFWRIDRTVIEDKVSGRIERTVIEDEVSGTTGRGHTGWRWTWDSKDTPGLKMSGNLGEGLRFFPMACHVSHVFLQVAVWMVVMCSS